MYRDGKQRIGHILMPIAMFSKLAPDEVSLGWGDHVAWRVPVDDDRHLSFMVDLIEAEGAELERYREGREAAERARGERQPADEVAAAVLRGELHVDDVAADHPGLVTIQDDVALVGQPPVGDRAPDRLGRSICR